MGTENMTYELENPGNIRERLLLYSGFVKKAEERRKLEESQRENERKED